MYRSRFVKDLPKVDTSTTHGGFEFKSTPYLVAADAMCHAHALFDSFSDSLTNTSCASEPRCTGQS
jgi:hypothetical protein